MINIDMLDHERIRAKLRPALVREPAGHLVAAAGSYLAREAQTGIPKEGGAVVHDFSVKATDLSAKVSANWPGALAEEFGRHSGTKAPPVSEIAAWAARHGLEGYEYAIAQGIKKRGVKGRFFMRRAVQKLRGEFAHLLRNAATEIEQRWRL